LAHPKSQAQLTKCRCGWPIQQCQFPPIFNEPMAL
jgi:hypothetical protein